jgi:hypothetical protein
MDLLFYDPPLAPPAFQDHEPVGLGPTGSALKVACWLKAMSQWGEAGAQTIPGLAPANSSSRIRPQQLDEH